MWQGSLPLRAPAQLEGCTARATLRPLGPAPPTGATVPAWRGYASDIHSIVRSREVGSLVDGLERSRRTGRPGYGSRALIGVCVARSVYGLPTWVRTTRLVAEHAALRSALEAAPSVNAVYRFTRKLRGSLLLRACLDRLVSEHARRAPGYGRHLAIDSTDLPAFASGQRYKYRGGPEREAFSDPDATWGHRSAVSTRKGGGFYGDKLHMAACAVTGLPIAWVADTGESGGYAARDRPARPGQRPGHRGGDGGDGRGYDYRATYSQCEERGVRRSKGSSAGSSMTTGSPRSGRAVSTASGCTSTSSCSPGSRGRLPEHVVEAPLQDSPPSSEESEPETVEAPKRSSCRRCQADAFPRFRSHPTKRPVQNLVQNPPGLAPAQTKKPVFCSKFPSSGGRI